MSTIEDFRTVEKAEALLNEAEKLLDQVTGASIPLTYAEKLLECCHVKTEADLLWGSRKDVIWEMEQNLTRYANDLPFVQAIEAINRIKHVNEH
jgi:hypothetical protein